MNDWKIWQIARTATSLEDLHSRAAALGISTILCKDYVEYVRESDGQTVKLINEPTLCSVKMLKST